MAGGGAVVNTDEGVVVVDTGGGVVVEARNVRNESLCNCQGQHLRTHQSNLWYVQNSKLLLGSHLDSSGFLADYQI